MKIILIRKNESEVKKLNLDKRSNLLWQAVKNVSKNEFYVKYFKK